MIIYCDDSKTTLLSELTGRETTLVHGVWRNVQYASEHHKVLYMYFFHNEKQMYTIKTDISINQQCP